MPARKKQPNKEEAIRKCLGPDCGKLFFSTWKGNRLCPVCTPTVKRLGQDMSDEVTVDIKPNN